VNGGVINAASLTALNGVSLAGGTILGAGTISGTLSGAGVLNAVSSLTVQNSSTISTIQIGIAGDPQLSSLVLNAASSATSLGFANASGGTLEINTAGSLTLTNALAIGANTVKLDGGSLTDTSGLSTGLGGQLIGFGTIGNGTTVNGTGNITASGGVLEFRAAVGTSIAPAFDIVGGATLKFDATVGSSSIHPTIAFDDATGTLDLSGLGAEPGNFYGYVSGFKSGDQIKVTEQGTGTETHTTSFDGTNTTLNIFDGATLDATVILVGNYTGAHFAVNDNGTIDTITTDAACFMAGTMILTPDGEVAVETLKPGDLVLTNDGAVQRVSWLGLQSVCTMFADMRRSWPVRIKAGALAENVPARDLVLSPDHAVLIDDALIQAGALINGTSIVRENDVPQSFVYYHVEVDDHSLILAENTPAETFVDNVDRLRFDNWAEHEALYPEGKIISELSYPRAKSHRQVPRKLRALIAQRAETIGTELAESVA
jgi:hypothetical protein